MSSRNLKPAGRKLRETRGAIMRTRAVRNKLRSRFPVHGCSPVGKKNFTTRLLFVLTVLPGSCVSGAGMELEIRSALSKKKKTLKEQT